MHITTVTVEESDKLFSWVESHAKIKTIRRILVNKRNSKDQIRAIRKVIDSATQSNNKEPKS